MGGAWGFHVLIWRLNYAVAMLLAGWLVPARGSKSNPAPANTKHKRPDTSQAKVPYQTQPCHHSQNSNSLLQCFLCHLRFESSSFYLSRCSIWRARNHFHPAHSTLPNSDNSSIDLSVTMSSIIRPTSFYFPPTHPYHVPLKP